MSEGVVLEPSRLIAGAIIGLIILLLLIIKFKVQAMVACDFNRRYRGNAPGGHHYICQ